MAGGAEAEEDTVEEEAEGQQLEQHGSQAELEEQVVGGAEVEEDTVKEEAEEQQVEQHCGRAELRPAAQRCLP